MSQIIWKGKPFKSLSFGKNFEKAGRNFSGKITIFHRGGGSKKLYRRIDYARKNVAQGLVERVEYDPNRTARIALIKWSDFKLDTSKRNSRLYQNNAFSLKTNLSSSLNKKKLFTEKLIKKSSLGLTKETSSSELISFWNHSKSKQESYSFNKSKTLKTSFSSVSKIAFSYILAWEDIQPGDEIYNLESLAGVKFLPEDNLFEELNSTVFSVKQLYQKKGVSMPLHLVPLGSMIYNIELQPGGGGQLVRAAGTCAQLVKKDDMNISDFASSSCLLRMPSGQQQQLNSRCRVTIGNVSNANYASHQLRKAGQKRWLGFRPVVRGVAMNPIDHPHGGGEGRTKGGRPSVSPWGKPSKCSFGSLRKFKRK